MMEKIRQKNGERRKKQKEREKSKGEKRLLYRSKEGRKRIEVSKVGGHVGGGQGNSKKKEGH